MSIIAGYLLPHQANLLLRQKSGEGEKTLLAYKEVGEQIARLKPDTIIIVTPHMESYRDYVQIADGEVGSGRLSYRGRGEYKFRILYDKPLAKEIAMVCSLSDFPAGMEGEQEGSLDHGTMVPLFFLNRSYSSFKAVRIGVSGLSLYDHYRLGQLIARAVSSLGRKAVVIASGDLSHTHEVEGHMEAAERYERTFLNSLARANFGALLNFSRRELHLSGECCQRPATVLAGVFDRENVEAKVLSKEVMGEVGLSVASFIPRGSNPSRAYLDLYLAKEKMRIVTKRSQSDAVARLAYAALDYYVKERGRLPIPSWVPSSLRKERSGVFVSFYKFGSPRGCLGTCFAREGNLANEIVSNTIASASSDPRYGEVRADELPYIEIKVDVLSRPERVNDPALLNPERFGLIVEHGEKRGVLLPRLDGISSADEQLDVALKKGRFEKGENYSLFRFLSASHR